MTRQKIEIKKIDNPTARLVTFSKRKRGLFKKARELSILCDAEVAATVFSATGKLFEYCSSSMKHVIERRSLHSDNLHILDHSSLELQLENSAYAMQKKEIEERTHELRQLKGEDLQGLNIEQLEQLEKSLEGGLSRVAEAKDEKIMKEFDAFRIKETQLIEENMRLIEQVRHLKETHKTHDDHLRCQRLESVTNLWSLAKHSENKNNLDTCLKLGLAFPS